MDCRDAVELLIAGLDRELTPRERSGLSEHLASCEACRAVRERFRRSGRASSPYGAGGKAGEVDLAEGEKVEQVIAQVRERAAKKRGRLRSAGEGAQPSPRGAAGTAEGAPRTAKSADIPGYEIIDLIGSGAMGTVYKARQVSMDRVVALKVLSPEMAEDREFTERFLREARVSGKLNHLNIVSVFDAGRSGGAYYLAMEYIEGRSVRDRLKKGEGFSEREVLDICLQVARALEHASRYDLIHRDVKPDNILVTADGVAKLCDLGLSRATTGGAEITQAGVVVGTPFYIAPEQAQGSMDLDARVDIYGLGCTLYHMLTGRVPFEGKTSAAVMMRHVTDPFPDPRKLVPGVSSGLLSILRRMVEKKREDRYASARELREDIEALIGGKLREKAPAPAPQKAHAAEARPRRKRPVGKRVRRFRGPRTARRPRGAVIAFVAAGVSIAAALAVFVLTRRVRAPSRRARTAARTGKAGTSAPGSARSSADDRRLAKARSAIGRVAADFRADPSDAEAQLRALERATTGIGDPSLRTEADAVRSRIVAALEKETEEYVREARAKTDELVANEDFGHALMDGGPLDLKLAPARARMDLARIRSTLYAKARSCLQRRISQSTNPVHEFAPLTRGMPKSIVDEAREKLGVRGEARPGEGK